MGSGVLADIPFGGLGTESVVGAEIIARIYAVDIVGVGFGIVESLFKPPLGADRAGSAVGQGIAGEYRTDYTTAAYRSNLVISGAIGGLGHAFIIGICFGSLGHGHCVGNGDFDGGSFVIECAAGILELSIREAEEGGCGGRFGGDCQLAHLLVVVGSGEIETFGVEETGLTVAYIFKGPEGGGEAASLLGCAHIGQTHAGDLVNGLTTRHGESIVILQRCGDELIISCLEEHRGGCLIDHVVDVVHLGACAL